MEKEMILDYSKFNDGDSLSFKVNGVDFKMVFVKGGTFNMGATSEQEIDANDFEYPTHQVTLLSYMIGETEVTQALWEAVMSYNSSWFTRCWKKLVKCFAKKTVMVSSPSYYKGSMLPMEQVSWDDCQIFIRKLNSLTSYKFRLPTEAEWEFAARGGNSSRGYKYAGGNDLEAVAWFRDNSGGKLHDVGTKQPNELGLYDMSGNIWEWCSDRFGIYNYSSQSNTKGAYLGSRYVNRGGCYFSVPRLCRVSNRDESAASFRSIGHGLRLAL